MASTCVVLLNVPLNEWPLGVGWNPVPRYLIAWVVYVCVHADRRVFVPSDVNEMISAASIKMLREMKEDSYTLRHHFPLSQTANYNPLLLKSRGL